MKAFDKKFGDDFLSMVPAAPGVYRIFDAQGALIYVGKAKNLRRRLGQYRCAKRRKKHRKMLKIVAAADRIEPQRCGSELEASVLEAQLIRDLRPRFNVAGAFSFLYPMIGMKREGELTYFCYTTQPDLLPEFDLHGAFRSREFSGAAFFSLMKLLAYVGHAVPRSRVPAPKRAYVFAFRKIPAEWMPLWASFWQGDSPGALETLVLALVENARARSRGAEVQDLLNDLRRFWKHEALKLARVRKSLGFTAYPVPQGERDVLFLRVRHGRPEVS